MAWNEPGSNNPWDKQQGPPDLEEMFRKLRQRFGGGNGANGKGSGGAGGGIPKGVIGLVAGVVGVLWLASGFYIVQPGERAVVLQFGKFLAVQGEGPHWHVPRPIQSVEKVNVDGVRNVTDRLVMLTQDENIVDLDLGVQYRVTDASAYLFNARDPDLTLSHGLKSALRAVVGRSSMDFILTAGREEVAQRTKLQLQETLDDYGTGLIVTEVNIKDAQPPEPVQGAFADAIKAREDEQRLINEAEAYANEVVPVARGEAARLLAEANGYLTRVVERAAGDAARFDQLRTEFEAAPEITRERLYLDTMADVLGNTSKILVDADSAPLMYLPLDRMTGGGAGAARTVPGASSAVGSSSSNNTSSPRTALEDARNLARERGRR
ncbi:MAG: FtsH protease activity modulator HflK [Oceanococcaceae bacterium]